MIKKFDLDTWVEYKDFVEVVTEYSEPVEIVKWDCNGKYPILGVIFDGDTDDACFYDKDGISMGGSKIFLSVDARKLFRFRKLKRWAAGILSVLVLAFIYWFCAATVNFIDRGGSAGIIAFLIITTINGVALSIWCLIDFIREDKKIGSILK